jgi:hypothetical protein
MPPQKVTRPASPTRLVAATEAPYRSSRSVDLLTAYEFSHDILASHGNAKNKLLGDKDDGDPTACSQIPY